MNLNLKLESLDYSNHLLLNPKKPEDSNYIKELSESPFIQVLDTLDSQVTDLIKLQNPSTKFTSFELEKKVEIFFGIEDRATYGSWVYYPWKNTLVRILPEREFIAVRTARNKFKITQEEQDLLSTKKIGIIGLSVGQSVAISLAMERSFGELRIADFDMLELGNMNRLRTSITNIGIEKTQIVVREIAEIDPYLKVTVFDKGINDENIEQFFCEGGNLDVLIEECDNIEVKIKCRLKAKYLGIPVLMDTSDRGMIDIERFDLEPDRPIFHGMLCKMANENNMLEASNENKQKMILTILDYENISERGKISINEIGKSITTWPQLGSAVILGGAICAHYAREIICGEKIESGRAYVDLDIFFKKRNESKNQGCESNLLN